jgi:acyl-CoA reductase-like NAD-dependent aldehyde dehydrogenase
MTEIKLLIAGKLVDGEVPLDVINPATGEPFARVGAASIRQAGEAVAAAKAAFPAFAARPLAERQNIVSRIADAIRDNAADLARTLTLEQGKPLMEARGEVAGAEAFLRHYSTLAPETRVIEDSPNGRVEMRRVPLGVVAGIVAWNFPLMLAVWKIGPALIAGNTIVLKPAPTTPATTMKLGALIAAIAPPGVVNILADAGEIGPYLTSHPDIAKVSFTGSAETGRRIMKSGAETLKRLTLELGGNDAAIVLDDVDVAETAPKIFGAATFNCGQVCLAAKRIYVQDAIYDEMAEALAQITQAAVVGDGLEQGVQLGPVQNRAQFEKVKSLIANAEKEGARIVRGSAPAGHGYFIAPTLVREARDGMRIVDEEQFGPVIPLIRFRDPDEAVARANASPFGLGASVWSRDPARAMALAERLEAGTVWVNQHVAIGPHIPMAGAKQSGIGVEQSGEGLAEYTQVKVFNIVR